MSRVVVFIFNSRDMASQAQAKLKNLEQSGALALDDALVLVKDGTGNLQRRRELPSAMIIGAIAGGLMGVLLFFMFPVISIVFGVTVGALIVRLFMDRRVDKDVVADAEVALRPDMSALILLIRVADFAAVGTALRPFSAQVHQATLSSQQRVDLCRALEQGCQPIGEPARFAGLGYRRGVLATGHPVAHEQHAHGRTQRATR